MAKPALGDPVRIAALVTAHNRRELTLAALRALEAARPRDVALTIFLTDDGSTDGTAEAVAAELPQVRIIRGDGSLYWNRGMLSSWKAAVATRPDFFLWLNDDLSIGTDALRNMLACQAAAEARHGDKVIVIGKTVSPSTGAVTYGGFRVKEGLSRLHFQRLRKGETLARTMNGNLVLIPARATQDVGLLDGHFTHTFGDIDYGLRASDAGYTLVEMDEPVGFQEYNEAQKQKLSRLDRSNWRFILTHPKGLPWREWLHFCRRHGGFVWPVNFTLRYLKLVRTGRG